MGKQSLQYLVIGVSRMESIVCNPFMQCNHLDFYDENGCVLPDTYRMYEFNYAFKQELESIFWTNYDSPICEEEQAVNPLANEIVYNAEEWVDEQEDVKDEESDSQALDVLGDRLSAFKNEEKYLCASGRPAFVFIFNTQREQEEVIEDGKMHSRVPLKRGMQGQWECPYCTFENKRFAHRCEVCQKRKTRYIPLQILLRQKQQQAMQSGNDYVESMQYDRRRRKNNRSIGGWRCPMCDANNDKKDENCRLCTLERPRHVVMDEQEFHAVPYDY